MPIHDWKSVRPGKFHHFHNSWIYKLSDALNSGLLPPGFYAAGEQIVSDVEPDVLTFQRQEEEDAAAGDWRTAQGVVALAEHPPEVSLTQQAEESAYLHKQDHLVVRSADDDRIVAMVEVVSRGNKDSRRRMDQFLGKTAAALESGIHLLIIDLHAPRTFDPQGIHGAIWDYLFGEYPESPSDRRLTLASYRAEPVPTAFVEPVAVGELLPDMPLFLDADWYINVPLEETYMQSWAGLPAPWRAELE